MHIWCSAFILNKPEQAWNPGPTRGACIMMCGILALLDRPSPQDHDGKISLEEWVDKTGSRQGFNTFDKDKDGYIGPGEYLKYKTHQYFTPSSRALPPMSNRCGSRFDVRAQGIGCGPMVCRALPSMSPMCPAAVFLSLRPCCPGILLLTDPSCPPHLLCAILPLPTRAPCGSAHWRGLYADHRGPNHVYKITPIYLDIYWPDRSPQGGPSECRKGQGLF